MKRLFIASLAACAVGSAMATQVGVSIGFSQPGVHGRIDIGRYPSPVVVASQPVIVAAPATRAVHVEPAYLWVPQAHRVAWHQHCHRYGACGHPVRFVDDRWYHQHVMPHRHPHAHGHRHGHGHGHRHDRND